MVSMKQVKKLLRIEIPCYGIYESDIGLGGCGGQGKGIRVNNKVNDRGTVYK